jgi:outer membrane protein OmpA-like peptidoglycan-associated protein
MSSLGRIIGKARSGGEGEGAHWLSISDLMAGLMMVFLFIAIALMLNAFKERDKIREVAVAYQDNQVAIYDALIAEFGNDLGRWDANIERETLAFEFKSPDVLFETAKTEIRPRFREILDDFFPRYLRTLRVFQDSVNEIRVEGHTSSEWNGRVNATEAYFLNMALSQGRTRSVLGYVYELPAVAADRPWIKKAFAAVVFSSAHLKCAEAPDGSCRVHADGAVVEDPDRSRRVTFRVITNAEIQIRKILEEG